MPQGCCVPNCRSVTQKGCKISFFTFPSDVCIRKQWIHILQTSRNTVYNKNFPRVCSKHFQPSDYIFGCNPRRKLKKKAVPSLYVPNPLTSEVLETILSTNNVDINQPTQTDNENETTEIKSEILIKDEVSIMKPTQSTSKVLEKQNMNMPWTAEYIEGCRNFSHEEKINKAKKVLIIKRRKTCKGKSKVNHVEDDIIKKEPFLMQCICNNSHEENVAQNSSKCVTTLEKLGQDKNVDEILEKTDLASSPRREILEQEMEYLKKENLNELSLAKPITLKNFMDNDKKIFYYTGFETYSILKAVFNFLLPSGDINDLNFFESSTEKEVERYSTHLSSEEQFFLTLIRLRRDMSFETLGDLFNIPTATAEKLFLGWLNVLYLRLGSLNIWPHRDVLIKVSPVSTQELYPNLIGSIDCTEIYIQKPSALVGKGQCYSNDNSHTTLKSLIMISPNGGIIYSSPLYSGSISKKTIINKSGFIKILKKKVEKGQIFPGDIILADKGFNVVDLFSNINVELKIPVFPISGTQLTEEVQITRKITQERILVERAIRRLKSYKILCNTIPIGSFETIGQIYHVCCWLTNFRFPLRNL